MSTPSSRRSRFRVQSDTALGAVRTVAQLTKDVTDIVSIPIASQVASVVLSLLEVVKGINDNNDARVRLATTAATYLIELEPILNRWELESSASEALRVRMERFHLILLNLKSDLEAMSRRNLLHRIFKKDDIATKLLDHKDALRASYDAFMMVTVVDTNIAVRTDKTLLYSFSEVIPKGRIRGGRGFFADADSAEARGQRVIVKRVNTTERDREARKWSEIWHSNLPRLAGVTNGESRTQLILFHDYWFDESKRTTQIGSVAAFVLKMSRTDDVFSIVDTLITFINDAVSAFRHMQRQLNLTEDETAFLAKIARYTLSSDGQIIVTPPLQNLNKDNGGVLGSVYWSLFPDYGTSESSMRRYLANLDGSHAQASAADVLDGEQLQKWSLVDGIRTQASFLSDKVVKLQEYVMPETRWAYTDYSVDVKPGDFGVFDPGEDREYAFRRVASPFSALFSLQSLHWMADRNDVVFDVVQWEPMTWKLDRLTDRCLFYHSRQQRLTNDVNRAKRFLELSAPKDCGEDELVFVVGCTRYHNYQYTLTSGSLEEQPMADVYAELRDPDNDDLCFSYCDPSVCLDSCPLGSHFGIPHHYDFMQIEYVIIPIGEGSANLESEKEQDTWHFRHWEYESIVQCRHSDHDERRPPWKEWP